MTADTWNYMLMRKTLLIFLTLAVACKEPPPPPPAYLAVPVERRDIVVSARANGAIQPDTTVEVKSKASGEILEMLVETGAKAKRGQLMVTIDPRQPRNDLAQAEANLEVAKAKLANATAQKHRADELFSSQALTETEHDQAMLDYANAKAEVVTAQVQVENAKIQLEDTDVRAPISGTIIEKDVERGQVISSPTKDVGGGTVLLKMADLNLVQVKTLVDETDIGKVQSGLRASITVDAYPNHQFDGTVLKIEPQATIVQNVTMFPVLVRIDNREGLLRPGMNTEVEIHVGRRDSVLAIPNAALRTQRDVGSAAQVLGLSMSDVQAQLAKGSASGGEQPQTTASQGGGGGTNPKGANTLTLPDGRSVVLPAGVTEEQVKAIFQKRMSGQEPTAEERAVLRRVFAGMGGSQSGGSRNQPDTRFGGRYIVFARRGGTIVPLNIKTGLTDLDYTEVVSGLNPEDSVLVLPSASLVQSQQEFKERVTRVTGSGLPGLQSPQQGTSKAPTTTTRP
jgi:HlyD family secretion protein